MKIIDAEWEKRNLGVSCYELKLELSDTVETVATELDDLEERQYMVAKIPSTKPELVRLFQERGYSFIETAIGLEYNYKKLKYQPPKIPKPLWNIRDKCTWGPMNEEEIEQLRAEIRKGLFETDRISLDSAFTEEQASRRYELWIGDLIQKGNIPSKIVIDEDIIGFNLSEQLSPGVYRGTLGGLYEAHKNSGVGFWYIYAGFMDAVKTKTKKSSTQVSSNNMPILRLHLLFGAEIKRCEYVFVKHNK